MINIGDVVIYGTNGVCRYNGTVKKKTALGMSEYYEFEALRGAAKMIDEGRIDFIQLEFGATTLAARVSFHDLWTLLSPKFELYRILKRGLHPIRRYEEVCELFMYQNLVAIRRK